MATDTKNKGQTTRLRSKPGIKAVTGIGTGQVPDVLIYAVNNICLRRGKDYLELHPDPREIMIATPNTNWRITNWTFEIELLPGISLRLSDRVKKWLPNPTNLLNL